MRVCKRTRGLLKSDIFCLSQTFAGPAAGKQQKLKKSWQKPLKCCMFFHSMLKTHSNNTSRRTPPTTSTECDVYHTLSGGRGRYFLLFLQVSFDCFYDPKRAGSFRLPLADLKQVDYLDTPWAILNERARLDCLGRSQTIGLFSTLLERS